MVSYLALASYKHENGFSSFMRTLHRYRQTLLSEDRIVKISSEIRPILIVYIYYNTYASRAECKTVFYERSIFTPYCYSCAALYRYIVVLRYINRVRGYLGGVPGYKLPRSHQGRYIRNVFIVVSVGQWVWRVRVSRDGGRFNRFGVVYRRYNMESIKVYSRVHCTHGAAPQRSILYYIFII